jgi:threonine dehydratase
MVTPQSLSDSVRNAPLADFLAARERIKPDILRTPLLPAETGSREVRLKPECLQPFGSFKIRCASNVLSTMNAGDLKSGVATASAGNFAQGLALAAKRRSIQLTVHAPESAASVKIDAIRSLGAIVVSHPFNEWWQIMSTRSTGVKDGAFIHPVCERDVIIGNGSVGLELAEDWPEIDTVVVPFGGGGLSSGIALALKALSRKVRVVACEVETAPALAAAFAAGRPVKIERRPSFVDGIGSNGVLEEMWPIVRELIDDVIVVSLQEVTTALRDLAMKHHIVAEGAGATALAAARSAQCGGARVAAVISGGNIEPARLREALSAARQP